MHVIFMREFLSSLLLWELSTIKFAICILTTKAIICILIFSSTVERNHNFYGKREKQEKNEINRKELQNVVSMYSSYFMLVLKFLLQ